MKRLLNHGMSNGLELLLKKIITELTGLGVLKDPNPEVRPICTIGDYNMGADNIPWAVVRFSDGTHKHVCKNTQEWKDIESKLIM